MEEKITESVKELLKFPQVAKQFLRIDNKEFIKSKKNLDPLKEKDNIITEHCIRRYKSRVAIITTNMCFVHCQYCFRQRILDEKVFFITEDEVLKISKYIQNNREIKEVLLTGGDVLCLNDEMLETTINILREHNPNLIIRLCTRALLTQPDRITDSLFGVIKKYNQNVPIYLMTQFNTVYELTEMTINLANKFRLMGVPIFNQTVLLKDINDNVEELVKLCEKLISVGIKPYYIFHPDQVDGTQNYWISFERTLQLEKELRGRVSGLAMPIFAQDLPESLGKIPLCDSYIFSKGKDEWIFKNTKDNKIKLKNVVN